MKKKFIRFNLNVPDRTDEVFDDDKVIEQLNADFKAGRGIYQFGDVDVDALERDNTLVIHGAYKAQTVAECKAMVKILKQAIKDTFGVKKVVELMVGWGDCV